jgi:hypothetical protein
VLARQHSYGRIRSQRLTFDPRLTGWGFVAARIRRCFVKATFAGACIVCGKLLAKLSFGANPVDTIPSLRTALALPDVMSAPYASGGGRLAERDLKVSMAGS